MARPRINPSARKIPISISVSPALADKIDEYSHQIRFSRSKFLAQAVTEAINKIELRHDLEDYDFRNLSDDRMAYLAKLRFDGADEINPTIVQQLKDAIKAYEDRQESTESDTITALEALNQAGLRNPVPKEAADFITFDKIESGQYAVNTAENQIIGRIIKQDRQWRAVGINSPDFQIMQGKTLKEVQQVVLESIRDGQVYF